MVSATILNGAPADCAWQVESFLQVSGCDELILSVLPVGVDRKASVRRTLSWIGQL
jgi:hypothetical protein